QGGVVRAVDADRATCADEAVAEARDTAALHREPVAGEILDVRVVEKQKLAPPLMRPLVDDHVETRRRAEVALVELAAPAVQSEDGREAAHAGSVPVDVEVVARLAYHTHVRFGFGPGEMIVVVRER